MARVTECLGMVKDEFIMHSLIMGHRLDQICFKSVYAVKDGNVGADGSTSYPVQRCKQ